MRSRVVAGEFSGEREGKEVRDFVESPAAGVGTGVTEALERCFRGFMRTVPDFRLRFDVVDAWDDVRCRLSPPLPSIVRLICPFLDRTLHLQTPNTIASSLFSLPDLGKHAGPGGMYTASVVVLQMLSGALRHRWIRQGSCVKHRN